MVSAAIFLPLKMMNGWRLSAVLLLTEFTCAGAPRPLTVVTFGDSTTAERPGFTVYSRLLEQALRERLHEPVQVINAGVRGNTTADASKRFEHDVLAAHPDLVVIQFGINDATIDVWKKPPATEPRVVLGDYLSNLRKFISAVWAQGGKVVLMTPNPLSWTPQLVGMYGHPPYDASDPDGLNINLSRYAATLRELAAETGVPLVDIRQAHQASQGGAAVPLVEDGMHPNQRGHDLVASMLADVIVGGRLLSRATTP
jgi:lysophospholipase L1-like esterase